MVTNARRKSNEKEPGYGYGYGSYGMGTAYGYYSGASESPIASSSRSPLPRAKRG